MTTPQVRAGGLVALVALSVLTACRPRHAPAAAGPPDILPGIAARRLITFRREDDLEALAGPIGDARVVILGEPSHADGAAYVSKARIIRFLHERLGFDVLAWEAPFFGVERMREALETRPATTDVLALGLFAMWARSVEVQSVVEYVVHTAGSARPLRIAGIDPQLPRGERLFDVGPWLLAMFDRADPSMVSADERNALKRALARFPKDTHFRALTAVDRANDLAVFARLLARVDAHRAALVASTTEDTVAFARQTLVNVLSLYDWHAAVGADVDPNVSFDRRPALDNVRDAAMAANVRWLLERDPRARVIVWAASFGSPSGLVEGRNGVSRS